MKDRQQDLGNTPDNELALRRDSLLRRQHQVTKELAVLEDQIARLSNQKWKLQQEGDDNSKILSSINNEFDSRKEAKEQLLLQKQALEQLTGEYRKARISQDPMVRTFADVIGLIIKDSEFQKGLPFIVEDSLEEFNQRTNSERISVQAGGRDNSCRLVLTKEGIHALVYYPKTEGEQNKWVSSMNKQLEGFGPVYEINRGMFYKMDLSQGQGVVTPGFMANIMKRGKISSRFIQADKEIAISVQPFQDTVVNILQQGNIVLPKKLGKKHSINRYT